MKSETIIYKGEVYRRYPKSLRRSNRVYFSGRTGLLHRNIWEENFGAIPKGYVIHHKDNNPLNNNISNLELMSHSKHSKMHLSAPELLDVLRRCAVKAREKAKLWKPTQRDLELYRIRSKEAWKKRLKFPKYCLICGNRYLTYVPMRSKCCSRKCSNINLKNKKHEKNNNYRTNDTTYP